MNKLSFTSPLPVTLNNYLKPGKMGNGMLYMYETKEAKLFKRTFIRLLNEVVEEQGWEFSDDRNKFYIIETTWFFDMQNRDSNNMWKIMLDAITDTQLIWLDDRQTIERTNRIMYDTQNPRVEIVIREAEWVGVFPSQQDHDVFIDNNCSSCSKNMESCTIYRNTVESRYKPDEIDIEALECFKKKIKKEKKAKGKE